MTIIKYLISILAICYITYDVDFNLLIQSFIKYDFIGIIILFGIYLLGFLILTYRWMYLSKKQCQFRLSFESVLLCIGVNNITPLKIGEVVKLFYLKDRMAYPLSKSLALMFTERLFDLLILSFFLFLVSFSFEIVDVDILIIIGFICLILFVAILSKPKIILRIIFRKFPENKKKFFSNMLKTLARFSLTEWFVVSFYSLLLWMSYFMTSYYLITYQTDFNLDLPQIIIVFLGGAIGMAIPSTPGGLGIVQAGYVIALGLFGINKEEAIGFAIVVHMVQYIPTTLFGVWIINKTKIDLSKYKNKITSME